MTPPPFAEDPAILLVAALAAVSSYAGSRALADAFARRRLLDLPNERSSHIRPTPRGAGLAVVPTVAAGWLALVAIGGADHAILFPAGVALALTALSFRDDIRGLPAWMRLLAHLAATAAMMPAIGPITQGLLPPPIDLALAAIGFVWFVNLYNFMDGIDGITGVQSACLGLGIALHAPDLAAPALVIAAAAGGFLGVNWHPARIFIGDAGSVPLGFLLGGLLLTLAARGDWVVAVILPLYYLVDATWTLLRRLLRGAKVWEAHREHFYQRAVQRGLGHGTVAAAIGAADLALIGAAALPPALALPVAALIVLALIDWLNRGRR